LYTFAQTVGCDLTITPEVSPAHLFPIALPHFTNIPIGLPVAPRLDALYDTVSNMFE
jgi:hypothetical protein